MLRAAVFPLMALESFHQVQAFVRLIHVDPPYFLRRIQKRVKRLTHVLHTSTISNDERVLYNDTETQMGRLPSHLLGSYVTHVLHTARIGNDERVLYNDTETLKVRLLSHLIGSYVTDVLHTARISNGERVLFKE